MTDDQRKPAREFTKVDRALEMQVIDWLQWAELNTDDDRLATLALELIAKRKAALDEAKAEIAELKTECDNRCEELAEALGEIGVDVSCAYDFTDLVHRLSGLVHEVEVEKVEIERDALRTDLAVAVEAIEAITSRYESAIIKSNSRLSHGVSHGNYTVLKGALTRIKERSLEKKDE